MTRREPRHFWASDEQLYATLDSQDAQVRASEANRIRRRALWNKHCTADHRNPEHCPCIVACDCCGHLAAEHEITDGFVYGEMVGKCVKAGCGCQRYRLNE